MSVENINGISLGLENSVKRLSSELRSSNDKISILTSATMANTEHLEELQKKVDKIDRCSKKYIDLQISSIQSSLTSSMNSPSLIRDLILKDSSMISVKRDIDILKRKTHCEEEAIASLRDVIIDVKDTMERSSINVSNMSNPSFMRPEPLHRSRERDLTRDAIESSAKLIRQLISPVISISSDLSLIQKSNADVKKVTSYVKACQDSLMKYISYHDME